MHSLAICILAVLAVGQIRAQVCLVQNANVFFVLDHSEAARRETSVGKTAYRNTTDFGLLRSSLRYFSNHPQLVQHQDSTTNLRVGAIAYTGFENTAKTQATLSRSLASLTEFGNFANDVSGNIPDRTLTNSGTESGGSWTFNGLEQLEAEISRGALNGFNNNNVTNHIVLISALGTFSAARQARARAAADRLKSGSNNFKIYVIGSVADNDVFNLDVDELGSIASSPSSDNFVQISTYGSARPVIDQARPTLQEALDGFVTKRLLTCVAANNPCLACDFSTGKYIVPDPQGCDTYLVCHADMTWTRMNCGDGTLYNADIMNCVDLNKMNCPAWGQCTSTTTKRNFPAQCCSQYYECNLGNVLVRNCTGDQIFDASAAQCVPRSSSAFATNCGTQDQYNRDCRVPVSTPRLLTCTRDAGIDSRYREVVNEPCKYEQWNGQNWVLQSCAEGTGWSTLLCVCTHNEACKTQAIYAARLTCQASVHMDFNNSPSSRVLVVDDSDNKKVLSLWVDKYTSQSTGSSARFLGNEGRTADLVSVPYFNNREYPAGFAMKIRYRLSSTALQGTFYDILANDNCGQCKSSLYLRSRVDSSDRRQVTVTFAVRDEAGQTVTLQASVTKNSQDDWLEVTFVVNNSKVLGKVDVLRSDLIGSALSSTSLRETSTNNLEATIAGRVARTQCALGIGQGPTNAMEGEVDDFQYIECRNPRSLLP